MKQVFTTGQVAKICRVAPRTVAKWVDSKKLPGYRLPGSNDRRVSRTSLYEFLGEHQMQELRHRITLFDRPSGLH